MIIKGNPADKNTDNVLKTLKPLIKFLKVWFLE
jgi:hypothetical protein